VSANEAKNTSGVSKQKTHTETHATSYTTCRQSATTKDRKSEDWFVYRHFKLFSISCESLKIQCPGLTFGFCDDLPEV
jgi:hypothetical protein